VTQGEIREAFAPGWRVEAIEPPEIHVMVRAAPARAWFAAMART
jgi:hypothetical protein